MQVILAYIAVIAIWSTTPLGIKLSTSVENEMPLLVARTVIGLAVTLLFLACLKVRIPFSKRDCKVYVASALSIVGAMALTYKGAHTINSGMIAVIYGLAPMFSGVLSTPLLGERKLQRLEICGLALAIIGLGVVFQSEWQLGEDRWIGIVYIVIAVFLYALSAVLVKRVNRDLNPLTVNAGALIFSLPFLILLAGQADYTVAIQNTMIIWVTLYLGVIGSFAGFVLYFYVLQKMSATRVMMVPLITPVFALMIGAVFNNEQLSLYTIYGAGLILSGLIVFLFHGKFLNRLSSE